ncbi:unnamed protein product [Pleuronectes platessa]|uniref:Uncharacterized protein n=1 Tax=Pleuronectes platessa TaxID=8262 RepID=A0A9N7VE30_PLEPL|nr:unnamed protein product [Pleuronectes platessa]
MELESQPSAHSRYMRPVSPAVNPHLGRCTNFGRTSPHQGEPVCVQQCESWPSGVSSSESVSVLHLRSYPPISTAACLCDLLQPSASLSGYCNFIHSRVRLNSGPRRIPGACTGSDHDKTLLEQQQQLLASSDCSDRDKSVNDGAASKEKVQKFPSVHQMQTQRRSSSAKRNADGGGGGEERELDGGPNGYGKKLKKERDRGMERVIRGHNGGRVSEIQMKGRVSSCANH